MASEYNDNNYHRLVAEFKTLSTFAAVVSWDNRAQAEVEHIIESIESIEALVAEQIAALEVMKKVREGKSFIKRLFSNDKNAEENLARQIEQNQSLIQELEEFANFLSEAIIISPNDVSEQKAMVTELKQRKKELQLEKKELAAEARAIRVQAQQESASAGIKKGLFFGMTYNSKLAAAQRRAIRYNKESILRPNEDSKSAIERQIRQVEKDLLWAEKFKT